MFYSGVQKMEDKSANVFERAVETRTSICM